MVEFKKEVKHGLFRKVAMGTWKNAKDPSVYGELEIDFTETLQHLEKVKKEFPNRPKITPTHLVATALAHSLSHRPEINGMIRGSKIWLRKNVSLFFQVNIHNQEKNSSELSGAVLHKAESMDLEQIASQLADQANQIRLGKDKHFKKNLNLIRWLPWWSVRYFLDITSFLIYGLNLNLEWLGIPKDPFGSAMITSVGSLGIDKAWAPLCPYTRVPLILTVGKIAPKPVVIGDKIVIRQMASIGVTFDHRFMDGHHAAVMANDFKKCFQESEKYLFQTQGK